MRSSPTTTSSPSTRPSPRTTVTPLRLAAPSTPLRIWRTTSSLRLIIFGKSNETSGTTSPYSSARRTLAQQVGGRQQGLRRDAAPVQAGPAQLRALDHGHLRAELCRAQGGDVAGRATAQHDDPSTLGHSLS